MHKTTDRIPAILASISPISQNSLLPKSSETPRNDTKNTLTKQPLETKWQQKWLKLENNCPQVQDMADEVQAWCRRFFNHDPQQTLLVIDGEPGNGKSHCAKAAFRWLLQVSFAAWEARKYPRVPLVSFFHWPTITDAIREKEFGAVQEAFEADALVLDDVGADDDPWKQSADKLCQILSRREKKFTLLTTNIGEHEWTEKFDARIVDRLMRNSVIVNLAGAPSYAMSR
jgi:DNA replication protein DnaC